MPAQRPPRGPSPGPIARAASPTAGASPSSTSSSRSSRAPASGARRPRRAGEPRAGAAVVGVEAGGERGAASRPDRRPRRRTRTASRAGSQLAPVTYVGPADGHRPGRDDFQVRALAVRPDISRGQAEADDIDTVNASGTRHVQPLRPRERVLDPRGEAVERARRTAPARGARARALHVPVRRRGGVRLSCSCPARRRASRDRGLPRAGRRARAARPPARPARSRRRSRPASAR